MKSLKEPPHERTIPADFRERLQVRATAKQARLVRLKDVYVLGDLAKEAYLAQRDQLTREVATLDVQARGDDRLVSRPATFLASIAGRLGRRDTRTAQLARAATA